MRRANLSIFTLLLSFSLSSTNVLAAYNHPLNESDIHGRAVFSESELERSAFTSRANLLESSASESDLENVLRDFEKRIDPDFRAPKEIRNNVGFWLRIYTIYTTQHLVIYDAKHPEIIYEVLDFRETAKTAKSRLVYEVIVKNTVSKTLKNYRAAFDHLKVNPHPKKPSPIEKNILAALKKTRHKHSVAEFAKSLRTQAGQRDNVIHGLVASEPYFPKMERVFSQMGLPVGLVRLSLVESSFDVSAISSAGASGVWQFMPESGKEYLQIDARNNIDERLSPLKATVAAAKLLKRNHKIFKNWAVTITSYNHGMTHLKKFANNKKKPEDFSAIAQLFVPCGPKASALGVASRNYYAEFLALLHAETYRQVLYGNIQLLPEVRPLRYVRLEKARTAVDFAMQNGVSLQEFMRINPDIISPRKALPLGLIVGIPSEEDRLDLLTDELPKGSFASIKASSQRGKR